MSLTLENSTARAKTDSPTGPEQSRHLIAMLGLAYSALAAGLTANAALASLRKSVPMSETVTSLHGSFFGWGVLTLCLAPVLTRRFARSQVFVAGLIATGLGAIPFALATNVWMSLGGSALTGFGCAALLLTIPAVVAQGFPLNRATMFSRLNAIPVTVGLSLPAALVLFDQLGWSWRIPIFVAAPLFAALSVLVARPLIASGHVDPVPGVHAPEPVSVITLLRQRQVRSRFILQVLSVALEFGFGTWVVVYLRDIGGFSTGTAPIGAMAWGVGMLTVRLLTPQVQRLMGPKLETLSFAGFAAAIGVLVNVSHGIAMVLAIVLVAASVGHVYSLGVDRLYVTAADAGFHDHDSVSILAAFASGLAIVLGPLTIGILADATDLRRAMFAPIIGAMVCSTLAVRRWRGEAGQLGRIVTPTPTHT